jgi:predicted metalloprotease with PDZ domain
MLLKTITLFATLFLSFEFVGFSQKNEYLFKINLNQVKNDQLEVNLTPPVITKKEITYYIPKIVPGTYSISDFGRFVNNFKAFDKEGNLLATTKNTENSWLISDAEKIAHISYQVDDTWDTDIKEKFIFEPAGTNIQQDTNFVLNTFGFFGYFDDIKAIPYRVEITKPIGMYASTALMPTMTDTVDIFETDSYMELADSPIMYSRPDTTVIKVGGADILISVYSPNKVITSDFVAKQVSNVLEAQRKYLGGTLPIKKYAFIIYLTNGLGGSGMMGALEHSYSSFYFLPEVNPEYLTQTIKDIAAHEFFHIITPLSIHSEEIHNFDYINPKMSKHLWLYEGVTEYFASHVQVKYGLIEIENYIEVIREKLEAKEKHNDTLPFTVMSLNCLDTYKEEYANVYQKGALIGLCLDITLNRLSDGKYNLIQLLTDLSKKYGKDKPFKDEDLFEEIVQITNMPELREFFARYVAGSEPLPFKEIFNTVGLIYEPLQKTKAISFGNVGLGINENEDVFINDVAGMDEFGQKMGYKENDIIHSINGVIITPKNIMDVYRDIIKNSKTGDKLTVEVIRKNKAGKESAKKLKGKLIAINKEVKHSILPADEMSEQQAKMLRAWLKGN